MLRWASINKKLVTRLLVAVAATGTLANAADKSSKKTTKQPIQRVAAEEVTESKPTAATTPTAAEDDGSSVFDKALEPDPWCAPGSFVGPQQPSQSDAQMSEALRNAQNAMNANNQSQFTQPNNQFNNMNQMYASAGSSRHVPAFMGDFFGGGGAQTVCMPGIATVLPNSIPGFAFFTVDTGGFASADVDVVVNNVFQNTPVTLVSNEPISGYSDINGFSFTFKPDNPSQAFLDSLELYLASVNRLPAGDGSIIVLDGLAVQTDADDSGSSAGQLTNTDQFTLNVDSAFVPQLVVDLPLNTTAGRVKLSENSSPIPRDRLLLNYSYFNNVGLAPGGINVNRITPGFEKTLFSKDFSFEVRTPMAVTMDQDMSLGQTGGLASRGFDQVEFGDLTVTLKALLAESDTFAVSTGLGMAFPTSDDMSVRLFDGVESFRIRHQSMHLMPFIGGVYAPNERFFAQWISQLDVATNGDPVLMNLDPNGYFRGTNDPALQKAGVLTDPTFMYLDLNAGYWTYRNDDPSETGLTGLALMSEVHYNRSLQRFDQVTALAPSGKIASVGNDRLLMEQLNFMVGGVAEIGGNSMISAGYAVPLTGNALFDGEFRMTYNYYFGRSSRSNNPNGNRPPGLF